MKLAITLFLVMAVAISCATARIRPTNEWLVFYDNGQSVIVEANDIGGAIAIVEKTYAPERIYSASQRSFVLSQWIWVK